MFLQHILPRLMVIQGFPVCKSHPIIITDYKGIKSISIQGQWFNNIVYLKTSDVMRLNQMK